MTEHSASQRRKHPFPGWGATALAAVLTMGLPAPSRANDQEIRLHGLFCNTQVQIDRAAEAILRGLPPAMAADLLNRDAIVCTQVERIRYVVRGVVGMADGSGVTLGKFRATLVGVEVGSVVRQVDPPVELFFVTPEPMTDVVFERRS